MDPLQDAQIGEGGWDGKYFTRLEERSMWINHIMAQTQANACNALLAINWGLFYMLSTDAVSQEAVPQGAYDSSATEVRDDKQGPRGANSHECPDCPEGPLSADSREYPHCPSEQPADELFTKKVRILKHVSFLQSSISTGATASHTAVRNGDVLLRSQAR